ncbi:transglutaminase-like domain-containing protein, partial [Nanoarchaeota archaeon]
PVENEKKNWMPQKVIAAGLAGILMVGAVGKYIADAYDSHKANEPKDRIGIVMPDIPKLEIKKKYDHLDGLSPAQRFAYMKAKLEVELGDRNPEKIRGERHSVKSVPKSVEAGIRSLYDKPKKSNHWKIKTSKGWKSAKLPPHRDDKEYNRKHNNMKKLQTASNEPNISETKPRHIKLAEYSISNTVFLKQGHHDIWDGKKWHYSGKVFAEDEHFGNYSLRDKIRKFKSKKYTLDDFVSVLSPSKNYKKVAPKPSKEFMEHYTRVGHLPVPKDLESRITSEVSSRVSYWADSLADIKKMLTEANAHDFREIVGGMQMAVREYFFYKTGDPALAKKYREAKDKMDLAVKVKEVECELSNTYFSLLLRKVGVAARKAEGYEAEKGILYTSDGHAWTEVYDPESGWVIYDATPTRNAAGWEINNRPITKIDDLDKLQFNVPENYVTKMFDRLSKVVATGTKQDVQEELFAFEKIFPERYITRREAVSTLIYMGREVNKLAKKKLAGDSARDLIPKAYTASLLSSHLLKYVGKRGRKATKIVQSAYAIFAKDMFMDPKRHLSPDHAMYKVSLNANEAAMRITNNRLKDLKKKGVDVGKDHNKTIVTLLDERDFVLGNEWMYRDIGDERKMKDTGERELFGHLPEQDRQLYYVQKYKVFLNGYNARRIRVRPSPDLLSRLGNKVDEGFFDSVMTPKILQDCIARVEQARKYLPSLTTREHHNYVFYTHYFLIDSLSILAGSGHFNLDRYGQELNTLFEHTRAFNEETKKAVKPLIEKWKKSKYDDDRYDVTQIAWNIYLRMLDISFATYALGLDSDNLYTEVYKANNFALDDLTEEAGHAFVERAEAELAHEGYWRTVFQDLSPREKAEFLGRAKEARALRKKDPKKGMSPRGAWEDYMGLRHARFGKRMRESLDWNIAGWIRDKHKDIVEDRDGLTSCRYGADC